MSKLLTYVSALDLKPLPHISGQTNAPLQTGLRIFFGITGATAVLIITIGALRLIMSRGNPEGLNRARNTIIYAAIGLVISIAAFSIVSFVVSNI